MADSSLTSTVEAAHERMHADLQRVAESESEGYREFLLACDAALAEVCQHLIGMEVALAPVAARRLPDGRRRVRDAMRLTRRLQSTVRMIQQSLWGDSHAPHVPLTELRQRLDVLLPEHCREEGELLADLDDMLESAEREQLAARWELATSRAPTRPHQHAWRRPGSARLYYRLVGAWDRALDAMDSRTLPRQARERRAPSLWGNYLLGAPLPRQEDEGRRVAPPPAGGDPQPEAASSEPASG